jgi:hypothetical protein
VIESSWEALVESLEYGMQLSRRDRDGAAASPATAAPGA